MGSKELNLQRSVYDLTEAYPELIPILADLGFKGVAKPLTRRAIGKRMTIPEGCKVKRVRLEDVIRRLTEAGFTVTGVD